MVRNFSKNYKKSKFFKTISIFFQFSGGAAGGGMPQDIAAEVSNIIKVSLKIGYVFPRYYYIFKFHIFFNILQVLPVKVVFN